MTKKNIKIAVGSAIVWLGLLAATATADSLGVQLATCAGGMAALIFGGRIVSREIGEDA